MSPSNNKTMFSTLIKFGMISLILFILYILYQKYYTEKIKIQGNRGFFPLKNQTSTKHHVTDEGVKKYKLKMFFSETEDNKAVTIDEDGILFALQLKTDFLDLPLICFFYLNGVPLIPLDSVNQNVYYNGKDVTTGDILEITIEKLENLRNVTIYAFVMKSDHW